jgi:AhpD family alkylhydroperoxidase
MHQPAPAHYHDPSDLKNIAVLRRNAQATFKAYAAFDHAALHGAGNQLPRKYTELIATAVGLSTQCVYCIEGHVGAAKKEGADVREVSETIMITAALRGSGGIDHGVLAVKHYVGTETVDGGHDQNPKDRRFAAAVRGAAPVTFAAFTEFNELALKGASNVIPPKYAELIALAVALTTQCSDCIDTHAAEAKTAGATPGEVSETVMITAALRAGGGMAHGLMALKHFEHAEGPARNESDADEQKSA